VLSLSNNKENKEALLEDFKKMLQSRYSNTESAWSGHGWCMQYGGEKQWRVFAYHQRREEYNESQFDKLILLDTPKNVSSQMPQNYECCYTCFNACFFRSVKRNEIVKFKISEQYGI
jgi:hypothetical protein